MIKQLDRNSCKFEAELSEHFNHQIPCLILESNTKPKYDIGFDEMVAELLQIDLLNASAKEVEVMISESEMIANGSIFSKLMDLSSFLDYEGVLTMYIAQFPLYSKV
jgi:hypothetical protein